MSENKQFICNSEDLEDSDIYNYSHFRKSKSLEDLHIDKSVTVKSSKSHSLSKRSNGTSKNNYRKAIFHVNTGTIGSDRNMFSDRRQYGWNEPRRSQLCEDIKNVTGNSDIYVSESDGAAIKRERNNLSDQFGTPKADFKTLLSMFLKRSSIYALNQVGNSASTRRKVFWTLIMIVGLIGSGSQIIQYLDAYFTYPIVVNMDSVYQTNQEFPAVTVCNLNRIQKDFLPCLTKKLSYSKCDSSVKDAEDAQFTFINDAYCPILINNMSASSIMYHMWKNLYITQDAESQIFYGHQGEDFIRSCAFNGEVCTLDNFTQTIDLDYGNCYTFNAANASNTALKTSSVGPNSGLELELDLEVHKYSPQTRTVGARVQVHNPYHEQNIHQQGINVSPGFETSISFSKFMMRRLPKPYKDQCKNYPMDESKYICDEKCELNAIIEKCSCSLQGNNTRHCDLTKMSDICCIMENSSKYACDCPLSCEDIYYQFNIFSAVWPSMSYYLANPSNDKLIDQVYTYEETRGTRLKLKVYYNTLEAVIHQQKPMYQSSELFSQIGGQMGLWLGLSLVALFECIENSVLLWKYRVANLSQINPSH